MDVSVIVVSYNTRDLLDACLESLEAATAYCHEVILVDNGSTDGSVAMARARHPAVRIVANPHNPGFAAANNQGARLAHGRYLLLLNADTRVLPGAIDRLVAFLDIHPGFGICAPRNLNGQDHPVHGKTGETQTNTFHLPHFQGLGGLGRMLLRRWIGQAARPPVVPAAFERGDGYIVAGWLRGCSLLVRADLYRALGGMDDGFFMYLEDVDLCRRALGLGARCAMVPGAGIVHYGGASYDDYAGVDFKSMIGPYFLRSKYRYVRKERGRLAELDVRLAGALGGALLICGGLRRGVAGAGASRIARGRLLLRESLRVAAPHLPRHEALRHAPS